MKTLDMKFNLEFLYEFIFSENNLSEKNYKSLTLKYVLYIQY